MFLHNEALFYTDNLGVRISSQESFQLFNKFNKYYLAKHYSEEITYPGQKSLNILSQNTLHIRAKIVIHLSQNYVTHSNQLSRN